VRAVRLHGIGKLQFEQVEMAGDLPPDEVRIRVLAAGVCGSDLHNYRTGQWMGRVPIIPGHEIAGEILELGADVSGLCVGELVVADSRANCGQCASCLAGRPNVCERMGYLGEVRDGGFAELLCLPASRVLRVPPGVDAEVAALAEPLGVALRVIRRLDPPRSTPILIIGAGPIGGLAAMLLQHLGFGPLLILDRNPQRTRLLASVAAVQVVDADAAELQRRLAPARLRFAIEATGSQAMLSWAVSVLAGGGRLAMVGLFNGEQRVDVNAVVERELDLRGCSVFCDEQREALALLPSLAPKLRRVISPPLRLEELPDEYERLIAGKSASLKSIVRP
jgi:(R,R)-butanediol dehydrogenase/meso-butanediol dehydrogenase/diacetyl reductase